MADVFISYAKSDRPLASKLAAMLEADGWTTQVSPSAMVFVMRSASGDEAEDRLYRLPQPRGTQRNSTTISMGLTAYGAIPM
jgi:hypothetical protein